MVLFKRLIAVLLMVTIVVSTMAVTTFAEQHEFMYDEVQQVELAGFGDESDEQVKVFIIHTIEIRVGFLSINMGLLRG